jgi:hypothetical protein
MKGVADIVSCLNTLEIVADPSELLTAAIAATRLGGLIIIASPYYCRADRSTPSTWLDGNGSGSSTDHVRDALNSLGCELVDQDSAVPWLLVFNQRYVQVWIADLILARRVGVA